MCLLNTALVAEKLEDVDLPSVMPIPRSEARLRPETSLAALGRALAEARVWKGEPAEAGDTARRLLEPGEEEAR